MHIFMTAKCALKTRHNLGSTKVLKKDTSNEERFRCNMWLQLQIGSWQGLGLIILWAVKVKS